MPESDSLAHTPGILFGRIASTIPVSDMSRAIKFYTGILGMRMTFQNGNPLGFAIMRRHTAEINLTLVKNHAAGIHNVAHLLVSDAIAFQDYLTENKVRIVKGVRDTDYGLRGFVFADPDGNRIDVGQERGPSGA